MAGHGYTRHGRTPGNLAHCSVADGPGGHRAAHAGMLLGFGTGGLRSAKEDQAGGDWAKGGCGMGLEGPWGQPPNSFWPHLHHGGMTPLGAPNTSGEVVTMTHDLMIPEAVLGSQNGC